MLKFGIGKRNFKFTFQKQPNKFKIPSIDCGTLG